MTAIRKFVYAALLAVTALNLTPSLLAAEEPAHGKFTLAHDVRWGNANVPAGEYRFSFSPGGVSSVLTLQKLSGAPTGFMMLVPAVDENRSKGNGQLILETAPGGSYVSSMELPESGLTLHFPAPRPSAQAMAATTASGSGQ